MLVKTNITLKDYDGSDFPGVNNTPVKLSKLIVDALGYEDQETRYRDFTEKLHAYDIATAMRNNPEVELTAEDIVLIKQRAFKTMNILAFAQLVHILEGKKP